jgi:hypothetical protein
MPKYFTDPGPSPALVPVAAAGEAYPYNYVVTGPSRGVYSTLTAAPGPAGTTAAGYSPAYSADPVPAGRGRS